MNSIFDIVGPIMIGPSSSHTAGAARLAKMARKILNDEPKEVVLTLYGSFAKTYKGHGTDKALLAGLLDYEADDKRIPNVYDEPKLQEIAYQFVVSEKDMGHPNVVCFNMVGQSGLRQEVVGRSLGGGRIMITSIGGVEVQITGEKYSLITFHKDKPGVVAEVTRILADENINISTMRVFGNEKIDRAVMSIDMDAMLSAKGIEAVHNMEAVSQVMSFEPI